MAAVATTDDRDRALPDGGAREPGRAGDAARGSGRADDDGAWGPGQAGDDVRRWASAQPNIAGQGIVAGYSARFWGLTVALGVVTGAAATGLVELLDLVERLAYGRRQGSFLAAVSGAPGWRHFAALLAAAMIVTVGLRVLRRLPLSGGTEVADALWLERGRLGFRSSLARALLSIVTVGLGVSLGREGAPQLAGAATASAFADWTRLPLWQRRLLVASGAGAGFAAVYNVPLGGAVFALEVLLGTVALPLVLPALITSVTATAVAWIVLGTAPTYVVPSYHLHATQVVWAAVMGPLIGLVAAGWGRLITEASRRRPRGRGRYVVPFTVFGALAALSLPLPQVLGNGKDIVQLAVLGNVSVGMLALLFVLKPLVTAGCITSGSPGGLFTPTFATGVLFTGVAGVAWAHVWPGAPPGSYALIGGGAFLAAAMQGPLSGTVLVLELARHFDALTVPTLLAVAEATIVARRLGAKSIYSARLRDTDTPVSPPLGSGIATVLALDEALPGDLARARHAASGSRITPACSSVSSSTTTSGAPRT
jgi:H+/Cl- antiporter ClcA